MNTKKVLLTTTSLVMAANMAASEVTFSGTGEAGFYRTAKTAAVLAPTKGKYSATYTNTDATGAISFDATAATVSAGQIAQAAEDTARLAILNAQNALANAASGGVLGALTEAVRKAELDLETLLLNKAYMEDSVAAAGKAGDTKAYSGYDLNVAVSGSGDNGMTFAMGFDMGAGLIADQDDDRVMDEQAEEIATSALTIGYNGYTIRVGDDKLDDLYDDTQNGDVGIAGAFGDLTWSLVTDLDDDVKEVAATYSKYTAITNTTAGTSTYTAGTAKTAAVYNPTSYSIGYTMGNATFSMAGTEHDDRGQAAAKMSLTYKVTDALSATLSSDNVGNYKDIGKLAATYTLADGLSITASVKDDKDHALNTNTGKKQSSDVSISFTSGAVSVVAATDESSNWWVNASQDIGGGAEMFATVDHNEFAVAGINFKF